MNAKQVLIEARKLIEAPERWTQDYYARDIRGQIVEANEESAVCWCSVGALEKSAGSRDAYFHEARDFLRDVLPVGRGVQAFNDARHRTHAEVLAAFDAAIAKAEADSLSAAIDASAMLEQDGGHL